MLNRRKFMAASAGVAVSAGATVAPLAVAKHLTANNSSAARLDGPLQKDTFTALKGEIFQLRNTAGQRLQARLVAVQDEGCCAELEQFSVSFQTEQNLPLMDTTYTVQHAQAGQCELYLVPNADSGQLTAMFSLLT